MEKTSVDINIQEFVSRFDNDLAIEPLANIDPVKLADFNIELYRNEFNSNRYDARDKIIDFWKWKYDKNPAYDPKKSNGWIVLYKGNMVGQFHLMPANIKIGNNSYRCAWGSDLAILAPYRNIGISTFLIAHARNEAGHSYAAFLLGGMNPNSRGVFRKSGFADIGRLRRYTMILDVESILSGYGVPHLLCRVLQNILSIIYSFPRLLRKKDDAVSVQQVDGFDEDFESFWQDVSSRYGCIAIRDAKFLKWRYLEQPFWKYSILKMAKNGRMEGYAVLREGEIRSGRLKGLKIGVISDILVYPEEKNSADKLIGEIVKFFRKKKAVLIKCDILNKPIEKVFKANLFLDISSPHGFMLNAHAENMGEPDKDFVYLRENWFITSGDSDFDFD